jgi:basic membrane protein A
MKMRRMLTSAIATAIVVTQFAFLPVAPAASVLSVGVAYDTGGPGDHSFDDAVAKGLESAKKRFNIQVTAAVTIGTDADRELRLRFLVGKDCNPIIVVGNGYANALRIVSVIYPSTQFIFIDNASIAMLNVTSLVFSENQGGYLAGVTAALATRSGKVGIVGTAKSAYESGFIAGAQETKKGIKIDGRYGLDSAAALTRLLINSGSDVVFLTTLGSDSDVLNTVVRANARGAKVGLIVIEPDQYVTFSAGARKYILASLVKRVDRAIVDVIAESTQGRTVIDILDAQLGIYGRRYGIHNHGIELSLWSPLVSKYRKVINLAAIRAAKLLL